MRTIKLLGLENTRHRRLRANLGAALKELTINAEIIQITDVEDILSYKVAGIPALVMDEHTLVAKEKAPSIEEICHFLEGDDVFPAKIALKSAGE
ncbi:MAG: thioredoxin family protein [Chitinophagales bacterium]|nr:thioredoxin family protein [Chitinophagales bacterium]